MKTIILAVTTRLFATGFTGPIDNLVDILTTIASALGGVILMYGVIKFAFAFKNQDNQSEHSAIFTIVAGAVLLAAGVILGLIM